MNIAVIFAGGVGRRLNISDKPKQFLCVHGKPIIVHTIEVFERHKAIDGIIVVCVKEWIAHMERLKIKYDLAKIKKIVPGGKTGQLSIYNGLLATKEAFGVSDNIALIHDGVRPLISSDTISKNIESVKKNGSTITGVQTTETFVVLDDNGNIRDIPKRADSWIAKAPQSFYLRDILRNHEQAMREEKTDFIDSCSLMKYYGEKLYIVQGNKNNIKITTPDDFYIFRELCDEYENKNIKEGLIAGYEQQNN